MSKVQKLRTFVKQRLNSAAEEIFELSERAIAEYEEELCRQRKLREAVSNPEIQLHKEDIQLLLVSEEEDPPEQQKKRPRLDQEDMREVPHMKEEQEELWTNQEGEQLRGLEVAGTTKLTFTPVPVSEEEEKPQSSQVQMLRAFVNQRGSVAAQEMFELLKRMIAEYKEDLCRQRKLLDAVFKPEVRLHRTDIQLLLVGKKEDPPEQQEWSPSLDQEDPPELPHIKEEQEELWTSQKGEQLHGLEETDITKVTFTPVTVKSEEDDEEKPQSSQLILFSFKDFQ